MREKRPLFARRALIKLDFLTFQSPTVLNSGPFIRNNISTIVTKKWKVLRSFRTTFCDQKLGKTGFFRGEHVPDTKWKVIQILNWRALALVHRQRLLQWNELKIDRRSGFLIIRVSFWSSTNSLTQSSACMTDRHFSQQELFLGPFAPDALLNFFFKYLVSLIKIFLISSLTHSTRSFLTYLYFTKAKCPTCLYELSLFVISRICSRLKYDRTVSDKFSIDRHTAWKAQGKQRFVRVIKLLDLLWING